MLLFLFRVALALAIAIGVGSLSALYAIRASSGFGAVRIGPWLTYPDRADENADPYSKARMAREGIIALGNAEGMEFLAAKDSAGASLERSCSYRIEGQVSQARFWTIYAAGENGRPIAPKGSGTAAAFHSRQLLRRPDGSFVLHFGAEPQPGNWAMVDGSGAMELMLTLYDTPISTASGIAETILPVIVRESCGA